jgi:DNA-directed RNA polymerase subunit K/omega
MENDNVTTQEFLPKYEAARIAVERARQIVKDNNDMISKLKSESNIDEDSEFDPFVEAENFSHNDSYAFDLYKIKSSNGVRDFIKNIFGVH